MQAQQLLTLKYPEHQQLQLSTFYMSVLKSLNYLQNKTIQNITK